MNVVGAMVGAAIWRPPLLFASAAGPMTVDQSMARKRLSALGVLFSRVSMHP